MFAALSGCASQAERPDANYAAYLDIVKAQQTAADEQRTAFAQMAQKCTSDACVSQIAAIAALAGASGHNQAPPQQYVPHESTMSKVGLALISQFAPLASAAVTWHASDTSRDVSLAQFGFLGGAVHDLTGSATSLGNTALTTAGSMTPSINVGHDYVPGTIDNGTHIGGDYTGGDRIGRDRIDNSGVFIPGNVDRYNSGGPYDDHSASGNGCAGSTTCQAPQPLPAAGTGVPPPTTVPFGPTP